MVRMHTLSQLTRVGSLAYESPDGICNVRNTYDQLIPLPQSFNGQAPYIMRSFSANSYMQPCTSDGRNIQILRASMKLQWVNQPLPLGSDTLIPDGIVIIPNYQEHFTTNEAFEVYRNFIDIAEALLTT